MKKQLAFILLLLFFSCKQHKVVVTKTIQKNTPQLKEVTKIENYVNSVDSYIYHININSHDSDSISLKELNSFKNYRRITKNVTQKNVTFKNNKIVKVKYKDYLENNFVKIKSFYYDNDKVVCIKIYELLPTLNKGWRIYKRKIYYKNNTLLLDTNKNNKKHQTTNLLSFGIEKLEEEYQSRLYD